MSFQKTRRHLSNSPRRGERSKSPRKQKRNAFGQFTNSYEEPEEETVTVTQPGGETPAYEPTSLFVPNLFVNSAEEGEINISTEIEAEGNLNTRIKNEEINEPIELETTGNIETQLDNTNLNRKTVRNRRRPNYYGTVRYC